MPLYDVYHGADGPSRLARLNEDPITVSQGAADKMAEDAVSEFLRERSVEPGLYYALPSASLKPVRVEASQSFKVKVEEAKD